jgi:hypothetical protein
VETVEIRIGNAEELRLSSRVRTHAGETVCGTSHARHHRWVCAGKTETSEASFTVGAEAATDIEWQDNFIALLDGIDRLPNLNDLAKILVAKDFAFLDVRPAFVHMEIGAADIGGGESDNHIGQFLDLGIGNIVDRNFPGTVVHKCFHDATFPAQGRSRQLLHTVAERGVIGWVPVA